MTAFHRPLGLQADVLLAGLNIATIGSAPRETERRRQAQVRTKETTVTIAGTAAAGGVVAIQELFGPITYALTVTSTTGGVATGPLTGTATYNVLANISAEATGSN
jgi:hypothetical protein